MQLRIAQNTVKFLPSCVLYELRMPLQENQKLFLLNLINDSKTTLFGPFDAVITRETKSSKWNEIAGKYMTVGGFDPTNGNGWKYLRDTVWPNMRQYTVRKMDAFAGSGAAGGNVMSRVDHAILDIIGKESPAIEGLPVAPDMLAIAASSSKVDESDATREPLEGDGEMLSLHTNRADQCSEQQIAATNNRRKRPKPTFTEQFEELKLKKMELEIEILQLQRDALIKKQRKEDTEVTNSTTQTE